MSFDIRQRVVVYGPKGVKMQDCGKKPKVYVVENVDNQGKLFQVPDVHFNTRTGEIYSSKFRDGNWPSDCKLVSKETLY